MADLKIAASPITGTIYVGRVNKKGDAWTTKQDVTGPACAAVVEHLQQRGGSAVVTRNSKPWAEITVTMIDQEVPRG